jgi:hypothetical protein
VDFVVYGSSVFCAIQVQNSGRVRPADIAPLNAFQADYPKATPVLLYRGSEALRLGSVLCLPVDRFLKGLHPDRKLLPSPARAEQTRSRRADGSP